jgi:PAS domain S-box-containing protein
MISRIEIRLGILPILAAAVLITVDVVSYQRTQNVIEANYQVAETDLRDTKEIVTLGSLFALAILISASMVLHRDITQRKLAEAALRDSETRYRTIFESAADAILLSKGDVFTDCSEKALELFRCTRNQLVGQSLSHFSPPVQPDGSDSRQSIRDRAERALSGRMQCFEWQFRRADGTYFDSEIKLRRSDISGEAYLCGIVSDISARKKTEAENARLVAAIEQSAEAVMITNTSGEIQYVNPAFTRITGYSREEVLGKNPRVVKSDKQDSEFYRRLWTTILKGENWHGEITNCRKDGSHYTEEMHIAPVRSPQGEITHFIATKEDISERKRLEDHLRQSQKMEAIGRLAGGVAHDFNNLLTVITGYGQLLRARLDPKDLNLLDEVLKASDRAASLTRQLLAFSRRQILTPQVFDLNSVVANTETMLRRLIGEDIELTTVLEPKLGHVKADPGQIEQVIMNLAVNARDAMPQGGKLTIETANINLDESYARTRTGVAPGPYVMLVVSDTGVGLDAETLGYVFEPFFTTKEKGKGTGLGLATVYGIVKQSSGSIWAYSEPGRGTSFKIYLPRFNAPATKDERTFAPPASAGGSETILVVEDEGGVRSLVCATLKSKGYKVLEARGSLEAHSLVERYAEPIHMLLTDVVMPQMSGKELAKQVSAAHAEAKVLFMSGYTDDAVVRHGILEASTSFLQKPFTPSSLARKVREVLDTSPAWERKP